MKPTTTKNKIKSKLKSQRREEEIEYTTEEEIFLPKPISRNGQLTFNNENKSIGTEKDTEKAQKSGPTERNSHAYPLSKQYTQTKQRDKNDFDEMTQGEHTLDYEITEPKCNGIQIMQIQVPRKNMNPSFFIPDQYKNTTAAQGSVSALSPINDYFGKSKNLRAQSPRVNQRQAKKMINSLDYKRNSDYSLNVNNNSTT